MSSLPFPISAFLAGIVSFLSPCVLPLVPGYVSLISGASVEELQNKDRKLLNTVLLHSLMFILGFTVVFVMLGAAATSVGQLIREYKKYLTWVAGAVIIIFGLHLTGSAETVTKGVLLLWVYSLGLAVPFLLTSLLIDRFLSFYSRFRKHLHTLEVCSGVLLMVLGVLILTRHFTVLSSYLGFLNRFTL